MNIFELSDQCLIGANVTIMDADFHSLDPITHSSSDDSFAARAATVEIGSDVFIGCGSYILKGVKIGGRSLIGAASVVTYDVPAGGGNPARRIARREIGAFASDNADR